MGCEKFACSAVKSHVGVFSAQKKQPSSYAMDETTPRFSVMMAVKIGKVTMFASSLPVAAESV